MWTTAGAIFSTTSAMKLNLYRGLVSWWRPVLAGRTRCISEAQTSRHRACFSQGWQTLGFPTLYRQGRREAPRGQDTYGRTRSTHRKFGLDLSGPAAKGPCPFSPRQQWAGVRKPSPTLACSSAGPGPVQWLDKVTAEAPSHGVAPSWAMSGCRRLSCQGPSMCVSSLARPQDGLPGSSRPSLELSPAQISAAISSRLPGPQA